MKRSRGAKGSVSSLSDSKLVPLDAGRHNESGVANKKRRLLNDRQDDKNMMELGRLRGDSWRGEMVEVDDIDPFCRSLLRVIRLICPY